MSPHLSFDLVIFGGSGDLAMRKLLPALYYRHRETRETQGWRILCLGRQALDREAYLALASEHAQQYISAADFNPEQWAGFCQCVDYLVVDAKREEHFQGLRERLGPADGRPRVFYLATAPSLFTSICAQLGAAGLATPESRVVLEKPLGHDLASSTQINDEVAAVFQERQIFRIDHYLGKEAVQNLIALRFGNSMFEPLWDRNSVRDVQITIAETVGVEGRGEFYDTVGAVRDMVQNHLLQLLCIVAMEPPSSIHADAVRDEKLKVLRCLRPITMAEVAAKTVRGQYSEGAIKGQPVAGYADEPGIAPSSRTETFVALKAELDNWRWAGVPFYLRTGKRMQRRLAEIVVNFRDVPHPLLPGAPSIAPPNRLVISLQPNEGLRLYLMAKVPGEEMKLSPVHLDVAFTETHQARRWDAYERLLMDVIQGKLTLFMRRDELDAAWRWVEPVLQAWQQLGVGPKNYPAGTWGPTASSALIVRDGHSWHEEY